MMGLFLCGTVLLLASIPIFLVLFGVRSKGHPTYILYIMMAPEQVKSSFWLSNLLLFLRTVVAFIGNFEVCRILAQTLISMITTVNVS